MYSFTTLETLERMFSIYSELFSRYGTCRDATARHLNLSQSGYSYWISLSISRFLSQAIAFNLPSTLTQCFNLYQWSLSITFNPRVFSISFNLFQSLSIRFSFNLFQDSLSIRFSFNQILLQMPSLKLLGIRRPWTRRRIIRPQSLNEWNSGPVSSNPYCFMVLEK